MLWVLCVQGAGEFVRQHASPNTLSAETQTKARASGAEVIAFDGRFARLRIVVTEALVSGFRAMVFFYDSLELSSTNLRRSG